jgi:hypothetical protein
MALWLLPGFAEARQLDFSRTQIGNKTEFKYVYTGFDGQPKKLSFRLDTKTLKTGAEEFQALNQNLLEKYVKDYLDYYATRIPNVKITVTQDGTKTNFAAYGENEVVVNKAIGEMQKRFHEAEDNYLQSQFFIRDAANNGAIPDHTRIAKRYTEYMHPVSQAIEQQLADRSPRTILNSALNFLQNIPYDRLEDRKTSNGAGFVTPYGLLQYNKGDCDTKSVALISIMRNLLPTLPTVIVYIPKHAFVGFAVATKKGDRILTIKGKEYVLAEPVGPGLFPVGEISEESRSDLEKNDFNYVVVP